jgi:hypothetical protein
LLRTIALTHCPAVEPSRVGFAGHWRQCHVFNSIFKYLLPTQVKTGTELLGEIFTPLNVCKDRKWLHFWYLFLHFSLDFYFSEHNGTQTFFKVLRLF